MSEEEKKAIEDFRKNYENDLSRYDDFNSYTQFIVRRDGTLLNLIEKQQKEIEEKSTIIMAGAEKVKQLEKEIEEYKEHYENMKWYYDNQKDNLIHKDKIREKIKELEDKSDYWNCDEIQVLKELLEEK